MERDTDKDFLRSLDKRVSDHDAKIASSQRDYTELSHEIKELLNRINNGLSPSVNEVRKENSQIQLAISNLDHKVEISMMEMKGMVKNVVDGMNLSVENFKENYVMPIAEDNKLIKKIFIYGVVMGLVAILVSTIGKHFFEKYIDDEKNRDARIHSMVSVPVKK